MVVVLAAVSLAAWGYSLDRDRVAWVSVGTRIDINSATVDMLCLLPGVGPNLARRIVEYRDQHGPFRSPDQLDQVWGIGKAKLAQMLPFLDFRPSGEPAGP